jgi:hypothetical protein
MHLDYNAMIMMIPVVRQSGMMFLLQDQDAARILPLPLHLLMWTLLLLLLLSHR